MIYEYFRATGSHEAVQTLTDLVSMTLQNDDVQDFDVRCDHALLSASDMPSDVILEGLYKSKSQNSVQLQTLLAFYDQETARNNGKPKYQQLKTAMKLHIGTFKARNNVVESGSVTKSPEGNKAKVERKVRECIQLKAQGQCSKRDSFSFSHDPLLASGNRSSSNSQRRKGRSSSPASHSKAEQTDGEKDDKEGILTREVKFCVDITIVIVRHVSFDVWAASLNKGCVHGDRCRFRHVEEYVKPNKKSNKSVAKRISCNNEGVCTIGLCISRFLSEKVYST